MVEVIKLNDKPIICPECGTVWLHETFTINSKGFKPKCGQCGYVWEK